MSVSRPIAPFRSVNFLQNHSRNLPARAAAANLLSRPNCPAIRITAPFRSAVFFNATRITAPFHSANFLQNHSGSLPARATTRIMKPLHVRRTAPNPHYSAVSFSQLSSKPQRKPARPSRPQSALLRRFVQPTFFKTTAEACPPEPQPRTCFRARAVRTRIMKPLHVHRTAPQSAL